TYLSIEIAEPFVVAVSFSSDVALCIGGRAAKKCEPINPPLVEGGDWVSCRAESIERNCEVVSNASFGGSRYFTMQLLESPLLRRRQMSPSQFHRYASGPWPRPNSRGLTGTVVLDWATAPRRHEPSSAEGLGFARGAVAR